MELARVFGVKVCLRGVEIGSVVPWATAFSHFRASKAGLFMAFSVDESVSGTIPRNRE